MNFQTTKKCPKCDRPLISILYGEPTYEAFEASERGEIILGGCLMPGDDGPHYHCDKCKLDFSRDLNKAFKSDEWTEEDVEE